MYTMYIVNLEINRSLYCTRGRERFIGQAVFHAVFNRFVSSLYLFVDFMKCYLTHGIAHTQRSWNYLSCMIDFTIMRHCVLWYYCTQSWKNICLKNKYSSRKAKGESKLTSKLINLFLGCRRYGLSEKLTLSEKWVRFYCWRSFFPYFLAFAKGARISKLRAFVIFLPVFFSFFLSAFLCSFYGLYRNQSAHSEFYSPLWKDKACMK